MANKKNDKDYEKEDRETTLAPGAKWTRLKERAVTKAIKEVRKEARKAARKKNIKPKDIDRIVQEDRDKRMKQNVKEPSVNQVKSWERTTAFFENKNESIRIMKRSRALSVSEKERLFGPKKRNKSRIAE